MKNRLFTLAAVILLSTTGLADFTMKEDAETGRLTVMEDRTPVLSYNTKPRLADGVPERYRRACYIHPLYDLDGAPITDDFPEDHFHHRGIWWSWPWMETRGKRVQLWHPSDPPLEQKFLRIVEQEISAERARIVFENAWILDGEDHVGRELIEMVIYPAKEGTRAIDLRLTFEAVGKPVVIRGEKANQKGYGGLTFRSTATLAKDAILTTDQGIETEDIVNAPLKWADLSSDKRGMAIFVHPAHPSAPVPWLIRISYGGVLNPEYPGNKAVTLDPGKPVTLNYRLFVHRGDAQTAGVAEAYKSYVSSTATHAGANE
ncbi:MAG: PmoA family protein [Verrucomicrobia bacterium]|nr:PmoA family protein [Verrucomicrobiota bacterium]MCF7708954.1 PmoA family protein [Verrucomicrobiota bacterium]